ncbi:unnamed protein product [Sphagnum compactum]
MKTMTAVTAKPTWPNQPAHFDAPSSRPGSNVVPPPATWAPVFGPRGMAVAQVLSSSEADRAPSSIGQEKKDTENWGKLIFRLKQKHPEQVQEENLTLIKEPLVGKSSTQDYLIKMLTEESLFKKSTETSIRMAKHQPPSLPRWNGGQNTAWTTLGIPATPSASGLQRMSQSSANPLGLESVKQPKKPEFSHADISASLECPNMDSGRQSNLFFDVVAQ